LWVQTTGEVRTKVAWSNFHQVVPIAASAQHALVASRQLLGGGGGGEGLGAASGASSFTGRHGCA
jgi:hypothetical protein